MVVDTERGARKKEKEIGSLANRRVEKVAIESKRPKSPLSVSHRSGLVSSQSGSATSSATGPSRQITKTPTPERIGAYLTGRGFRTEQETTGEKGSHARSSSAQMPAHEPAPERQTAGGGSPPRPERTRALETSR